MTTISDARLAIQSYLQEMNLSPYDVKITGYDASSPNWSIRGQFHTGFMGEIFTFEAIFDSRNRSVTKFDITGKHAADAL